MKKPTRRQRRAAEQIHNRGGRPNGPTMPCGWRCGARLTATEMRPHFTDCPRRPR